MKKILSFLVVMSLMLVMVGVVSAASWGVNFISPIADEGVSDELIVEWTNEFDVEGLYLQYTFNKTCSPANDWNYLEGPLISTQTTFEWDTKEVDDGLYCLRLGESLLVYDKSEPFTIDNTPPNVMMSDVSFPAPDEKTNQVTVAFVHSDNIGVTFCQIDFGGMKTKNCLSGSQKSYQFNDNGNYDVTITVEDAAGHTATDSVDVEVANVAPWNVAITNDPKVAASGEAVLFTASADDVDADKPLTFTWTFDNDEVVSEFNDGHVTYTWDSASPHFVDLCVSDGDDETCIEELYEIEIIDPTPLADQKVIAGESLDADFGDGFHKFPHSVVDGECSLVPTGTPVGMEVGNNPANTKCRVEWNNPKPTNEQRGINHVTIKVIKDDNYEYYSFDVTVYSWGIDLAQG